MSARTQPDPVSVHQPGGDQSPDCLEKVTSVKGQQQTGPRQPVNKPDFSFSFFLARAGDVPYLTPEKAFEGSRVGVDNIVLALYSGLFAFGGWWGSGPPLPDLIFSQRLTQPSSFALRNYLNYVTEEMINPERWDTSTGVQPDACRCRRPWRVSFCPPAGTCRWPSSSPCRSSRWSTSWPTWPTSPPSLPKSWSTPRPSLWWVCILLVPAATAPAVLTCLPLSWLAEFRGVPSWGDVLADTCLCRTVLLRSCQWVPLHLCTVCVCVCVYVAVESQQFVIFL